MAWLITWLAHGLAIAVIARAALRALPGLSAATRYAIWWAAVLLVLLLPALRGGLLLDAASARVTQEAATAAPPGHATPPVTPEKATATASRDRAPARHTASSSAGQAAPAAPWLRAIPMPRVPDWLAAIAIGAWLGATMLALAQLAYSVQVVRGLKRSCRLLPAPIGAQLPVWSAVRRQGRAVRVCTSDRIRTAAVLGLVRPVIVVPRDLSASLTPEEVEQVLLHEYAHVQRFDDWAKLLQVVISAFFGWHPAVRLMMREIDFEREAACDDWVVETTGAPRAYARCLTKMATLPPSTALALVPNAVSARHTAHRIERLLDRRRPTGRFAPMPAMAGSVALTALAFCTVHALPFATDAPHATNAPTMAAGGPRPMADVATSTPTSTSTSNVAMSGATQPNANASADGRAATSGEDGTGDLRIAAASMLPLSLPFGRFARTAAAALGQHTGFGQAASTTVDPALSTADSMGSSAGTSALAAPVVAERGETTSDADRAPAAAAPALSASGAHADRNVASSESERASTPSSSSRRGGHGAGDADMARIAASDADRFELGSVSPASDPNALAAAAENGPVGSAWNVAKGATSYGVGVGARAVGTATRTATEKTAFGVKTAATSVKKSGAKGVRFLGRIVQSAF